MKQKLRDQSSYVLNISYHMIILYCHNIIFPSFLFYLVHRFVNNYTHRIECGFADKRVI